MCSLDAVTMAHNGMALVVEQPITACGKTRTRGINKHGAHHLYYRPSRQASRLWLWVNDALLVSAIWSVPGCHKYSNHDPRCPSSSSETAVLCKPTVPAPAGILRDTNTFTRLSQLTKGSREGRVAYTTVEIDTAGHNISGRKKSAAQE